LLKLEKRENCQRVVNSRKLLKMIETNKNMLLPLTIVFRLKVATDMDMVMMELLPNQLSKKSSKLLKRR